MALKYHQKSLNTLLKTLEPEHPFIAFSYYNIGFVYQEKGEYGKSLEYYQKSLDIRLKSLGSEHPYVADCYDSIGILYFKKSDYEKPLFGSLVGEFVQKLLAML